MTTWAKMDGHARNSLVAEKLFGWQSKPCDLEETDGELTIYDSGDACCPRCGVYDHINSLEHGVTQPPHYTTSMDAAWLVVEKLLDKAVFTCEVGDWTNGNKYVVITFDRTPAQNEIRTTAETMPEAICLAALRAIGVEVEKDTA